jgi:hypothetical protein
VARIARLSEPHVARLSPLSKTAAPPRSLPGRVAARIARLREPTGTPLHDLPVAYLLDATESNGDATNYWIFSDAGLHRILHRTGWDVLAFETTGDRSRSNPADQHHDERAFCLLRSRVASVP